MNSRTTTSLPTIARAKSPNRDLRAIRALNTKTATSPIDRFDLEATRAVASAAAILTCSCRHHRIRRSRRLLEARRRDLSWPNEKRFAQHQGPPAKVVSDGVMVVGVLTRAFRNDVCVN